MHQLGFFTPGFVIVLREDQDADGWSASLLGEIEKQWPQGGMFNPKGGFPLMGQYVKSSSWMVYTFSLPQVFAIELVGGFLA